MANIGKLYTNSEKLDIEWRIENFLSLWNCGKRYYASPTFDFGGATWCINIYPNGNSSNSDGFISLYLFRKYPFAKISVDCSFGFKNLDGKDNGKNQPAHAFISGKRRYGIPCFLSRSDFLERQSQLLPCNTLTVLCSITFPKTSEDAVGGVATEECLYCKEYLTAEDISSHEKKCTDRPIKCPACYEVVLLRDWYNHECPTKDEEDHNDTTECSYCQKLIDTDHISWHEEKCMNKPIKCPECCDVIALMNWYDHECKATRTEGAIATAECPYCKRNLDAKIEKRKEYTKKTNVRKGKRNASRKKEFMEKRNVRKGKRNASRKKECTNKAIKCSECSKDIPLQDYIDLEYQITRNEVGGVATEECIYCKEYFTAEDISFHEKKCTDRPIKCPECYEVVLLRDWYDHECPTEIEEEYFTAEDISFHEKKCTDRSLKCPECHEVVLLRDWCDHECPTKNEEGGGATIICSYCKENVAAKCILSHENKCMQRPIKCPECSDVIPLKNWYEHKCQAARTEDRIATAEFPYCTENLDAKIQRKKKCTNKAIKCSECSKDIPLQDYMDHEYQITRNEVIRTLSRDYKKVLSDGMNHDLIFMVRDRKLRAHRDILRARSRVFESMLTHDMIEKNSGVIDVPDCDPEAMELFLTYIYCGKVETLDQTNMLGLYYIADKYDMQSLKMECCDFIKMSLSATNICEVVQLAMNHSDTGLLEHATEYFINHVLDIMRTVEWQCFLKENSTVGNELLIKSFEKLKT